MSGKRGKGPIGPSSSKNLQNGSNRAGTPSSGVTSDEDDGARASGSNNWSSQQRQDPRERRQIRKLYSELREQTQAKRHDLIKPNSMGLQETLEQTEQAFKNVRETREAAMDSQMLALISQLTKQQAQALHTDLCVFEPVEFAGKLISLIGGHELPAEDRERSRISRDGWVKLGEAAQPFFRRSPALHCMLGTFERGPPKKKPPVVRKVHQKDDNAAEKGPTAPKQLASFKDTKSEEVTTVEVERMFDTLQYHYQRVGRKPLCYFEFVINPDSFGLTVENIFYASFLVRDGHARIFLDKDKLPVIEPVEKMGNEDQLSRLPRHQVVMTITPEEWARIVETFGIKQPMIKPREQAPIAGVSGKKKSKR